MKFTTAALAAASLAALAAFAVAQGGAPEAALRKALAERLPALSKIDEISKTPMAGLYELRVGKQVYYTDAEGGFLIEGNLIDLKAKRNLTEERLAKLTAIDFDSLPLKDAIVWKTGSGKRKIAVFSDPNCGYCKRFERELTNVKDLTVYTFLIPILGGDSPDKAKAIWCAKDPTVAYREWMVDGMPPPKPLGACSTPIDRNMELRRRHEVNGTPAIVFEDGTRIPGMLTAPQLEKQLAASSRS